MPTESPGGSGGPIAFACAMPMELAPLTRRLRLARSQIGDLPARTGSLDGRDVVGIVTGIGTRRAAEATRRLLDAVTPSAVLVVGVTGAVDDETAIGTVVLPEVVVDGASGREHRHEVLGGGSTSGVLWTSDVLTTAAGVPELRAKGVVALDMETAAIALVCEERGVRWSVFRAVSDRATDGSVDDDLLRLLGPDGRADPWAVARHVARHPSRLPVLARLARGSQLAARRAAEAAIAAVRSA